MTPSSFGAESSSSSPRFWKGLHGIAAGAPTLAAALDGSPSVTASALHFRIVLKVKGIEDVHDRRRLFRIEQDGQPAPDSD